MFRRVILSWSLLAALVVVPAVAVVVGPLTPVAAATGCVPGSEFELRDLMNGFRAANGKPALPLSAELNAKAQAWADRMMNDNLMRHSDTVPPYSLSVGLSANWQAVGENVAYNSRGLAAAETALENSPPHRKNLLGQNTWGDWTEMGVGISRGPNGYIWVAQVFVKRPTPTSLVTTSAYTPVSPTTVFESVGITPARSVTPIQVTGVGGVPGNSTAAVVNIEVLESEGSGYVQALAPGQAPGTTSNVNIIGTDPVANTAVVPLSTTGQMRIFNFLGARMWVTVVGYFSPAPTAVAAGRFIAVNPTRVLDTRPNKLVNYSGDQPAAGETITARVNGLAGVPTTGVRAVVLNVVATQTTDAGSVQVGAGGLRPGAWRSLLMAKAGQTISNLVIVPVDANGDVDLYTDVGTHLVVDVQGWFTTSSAAPSRLGLFVPTASTRFLDTRSSAAAWGEKRVSVDLRYGQPTCPTAVLGNLTVIPVGGPSYVQVGPAARFTWGAFSNVNMEVIGAAVANAMLVLTGADRDIGAFIPVAGHVIVDLSGWFV